MWTLHLPCAKEAGSKEARGEPLTSMIHTDLGACACILYLVSTRQWHSLCIPACKHVHCLWFHEYKCTSVLAVYLVPRVCVHGCFGALLMCVFICVLCPLAWVNVHVCECISACTCEMRVWTCLCARICLCVHTCTCVYP